MHGCVPLSSDRKLLSSASHYRPLDPFAWRFWVRNCLLPREGSISSS